MEMDLTLGREASAYETIPDRKGSKPGDRKAELQDSNAPVTIQPTTLPPSDFHLFGQLKDHLRGHQYEDDYEVKAVVKEWIRT